MNRYYSAFPQACDPGGYFPCSSRQQSTTSIEFADCDLTKMEFAVLFVTFRLPISTVVFDVTLFGSDIEVHLSLDLD